MILITFLKKIMPSIPKISKDKISLVRKLYCEEKCTMLEVAQRLGVSICSVEYCMRRNNIPRRSFQEANAIVFARKKLSFREKIDLSPSQKKTKSAWFSPVLV